MKSVLSMTPTISRSVLATVGIAAAVCAGALTPAYAHDELISSNPENGAELETAPDALELTYSGEIMDIGNQVRVTNSVGDSVAEGEPTVNGKQVTQNLNLGDAAADETYTVTWRVVSSDGHPIQGTYEFVVGEGASDTAAAPAEAFVSDAPKESASADATTDNVSTATGLNATNIVIMTLAALATIGMVGVVVAKNRKN
ncbi:copper resistance CopC family protein [Rothia sp. ZJ932]|uniref:copper resistance CopC family protein n=1 Tax=Rothia sp. ZJ932 TaxID=2810516 RepID=UPI0019683349|nr:copper resistance CopC family protein [Rothia sp. ZJ932]QRZ61307.1 copper resistance protein CopC [Rothia sp. ZJ932]